MSILVSRYKSNKKLFIKNAKKVRFRFVEAKIPMGISHYKAHCKALSQFIANKKYDAVLIVDDTQIFLSPLESLPDKPLNYDIIFLNGDIIKLWYHV